MKVTAKATFIHGTQHIKRGETVDMAAATAESLMKSGVVREATKADEKSAPKVTAKPATAKADAKE